MKKTTKQLIAILLAVFLLTTSVPVSVFAASADSGSEEPAAEEGSGESREETVEAEQPSGEDKAPTEETAPEKTTEDKKPADIPDDGSKAVSDSDEQQKQEPKKEALTVSNGSAGKDDDTVYPVKKGSSFVFEKDLSEMKVTAVVSRQYVDLNSVMKVQVLDAAAYQTAVQKKHYGKRIDSLSCVEFSFLDNTGNSVNVKADITLTSQKTGSDQYILYQTSGTNAVKKPVTSASASATARKTTAVSFVLAGLSDDGIDRTQGVTRQGTTVFTINKEGVTLTITTPDDSFPENTWMEMKAADTVRMEEAAEKLLGKDKNTTVLEAVSFSFHTPVGKEIKPKKDMNVNISYPLDMSGNHALVRVKNDGTALLIKKAVFSGNGVKFAAKVPASYGIVEVTEDKALEAALGDSTLTVNAPEGAFAPGTEIQVDSESDPEILKSALSVLDQDKTYSFKAMDISFDLKGKEVEPAQGKEVEVIWEDDFITPDSQIVHIKDDGSAELIDNAVCTQGRAVFTAKTFSTYVTTRLSSFKIGNDVVFDLPEDILRDNNITGEYEMESGFLSETHPNFDGYTFEKAVYEKGGIIYPDEVLYLGAFIYSDESVQNKTYIYYRTADTINEEDDMIVRLAEDETIHLIYKSTPIKVTYKVVYNGTTYTIENGEIPEALKTAMGSAAADQMVVEGPDSVEKSAEYLQAVKIAIPRGYTATVTRNNSNMGTLGVEPTYQVSDPYKVISKTGNLELNGVYDFPAVTTPQTITITLTQEAKTFNARYFLATVYAGGEGTTTNANLGDRYIADRQKARITSDENTITKTGNNAGTGSITNNSYTWSFWTNVEVPDNINYPNDRWMIDALEINGTTIEVPYANTLTNGAVSKTTTLPSGTVVTLTLDEISSSGGTGYTRHYTLNVTNAYENIVITGGNIVNAASSTEIIPEVLDNVEYAFYGHASSDDGYDHYNNINWQEWGVGGPIEAGPRQSVSYATREYIMYGFNETNNNAMRFKLKDGYYNPEIAYVSTVEDDLISYVGLGNGLSRGAKKDGYYPISGNPTNGYYYFRISGNGDYKQTLLRIRASLKRYGVSYDVGNDNITDAKIPGFDAGGYYDAEQQNLQGYNVVDNPTVVVADSAPVDKDGNYIFLYYTIQGDTSGARYAPSQKIPLKDIVNYGVYVQSKNEFVIPFVAHWEEKTNSTSINMHIDFFLDDVWVKDIDSSVPETSSVYIDIDSNTMKNFMNSYNWQLFYDEVGSNPFIREVTEENNEVELRLYSKFYIYHSSTGDLELHTTKEMETGEGDNRKIGNLNITKYVASGTLYGGYYRDYDGAHSGSTNLVKAAADHNNNEETLTNSQIETLSNKGFVKIGDGIGTTYDPANSDHVGWFKGTNAFTSGLVTANSSWTGDRGPDNATLQTGGKGTSVKIARAGIYYLKEVPNSYLRPAQMTTYQRYDNYLRDFILFSTTDDTNYQNAGFIVSGTAVEKEFFTDNLTISFGANYDETVNAGSVGVSTKEVSSNQYGLIFSKRIFSVDESALNYSGIIGTKSVKAYWITPDSIRVTGPAMRRSIVTDKNSDSIIQVKPYEKDGKEVKEITYTDLSTTVKLTEN